MIKGKKSDKRLEIYLGCIFVMALLAVLGTISLALIGYTSQKDLEELRETMDTIISKEENKEEIDVYTYKGGYSREYLVKLDDLEEIMLPDKYLFFKNNEVNTQKKVKWVTNKNIVVEGYIHNIEGAYYITKEYAKTVIHDDYKLYDTKNNELYILKEDNYYKIIGDYLTKEKETDEKANNYRITVYYIIFIALMVILVFLLFLVVK